VGLTRSRCCLSSRLARPWRLTLTAVHCNYGLRGAESDGDESFVKTFCHDRHLSLVIHRPKLLKRRQRSSLQAAARDARYDFMKQLAHEVGADYIAVGHTANDQAETVLMWMLRGAGMAGLAGMSYAREDKIIRPLLDSTREEVLAYLDHEGLTYRLIRAMTSRCIIAIELGRNSFQRSRNWHRLLSVCCSGRQTSCAKKNNIWKQ
jgi:tRNA(Ile)-lysidine synthetase, N-terminal domain